MEEKKLIEITKDTIREYILWHGVHLKDDEFEWDGQTLTIHREDIYADLIEISYIIPSMVVNTKGGSIIKVAEGVTINTGTNSHIICGGSCEINATTSCIVYGGDWLTFNGRGRNTIMATSNCTIKTGPRSIVKVDSNCNVTTKLKSIVQVFSKCAVHVEKQTLYHRTVDDFYELTQVDEHYNG